LTDRFDPEQQTTVGAALRHAMGRLTQAGSPTPRLDAEVLLRHVLGLDRTALFIALNDAVSKPVLADFETLVAQRSTGIPVAYLVGAREFMGHRFAVGPGALVPRPETELLVVWALDWISARTEPPRVVDVGTGPGTIALTIALTSGASLPPIIAADRSPEALEQATLNRSRFGLQDRVHLVHGDLLTALRGPVDLIIANLPYLRPDQIDENPDLRWEPRLALEGGRQGIDLIHRLLDDAPRVLTKSGAIGLEIDPSHGDEVAHLAEIAFPGASIQLMQDLAGDDRFVIIEREPASFSGPQ
jgi:release factor glutamine methyltransferase